MRQRKELDGLILGLSEKIESIFMQFMKNTKELEKKRDIGMIGRILLKQFIVSCYQIKMRECTSI